MSKGMETGKQQQLVRVRPIRTIPYIQCQGLWFPNDAKPEEQRQRERDCAQKEHFEPLIGGEVEPGLIKKNMRKGNGEQMEQPHEPAEDLESAQELRFFRHVHGAVNESKGFY